MDYPNLLNPTDVEQILLPSGHWVSVPKATPLFARWTGEPLEDTYGGKPILVLDGEPVFAELAILRVFQRSGWDGVWVDTFSRVYRTGYWDDTGIIELPPDREGLLRAIDDETGTGSGGCWDVFCWKGDMTLFVEAKRRGRDKIRESQRQWLEAALGVGFSLRSFLVVEWSSR